jgi:predicted 3-demethylubiquinone-9 3-methyltransferase (glyoxalase superfamily)
VVRPRCRGGGTVLRRHLPRQLRGCHRHSTERLPGLNGGTAFQQSEAFSFQIATDDQEETDRLWNAIVDNGGQESACGWCKDRWGLSWQITPRALSEAMADPDPTASKRVFEAMMTMRKIDIAAIERARRG